VFGRLDAGHSLRSIAADFKRRGIVSRTGKPFASQLLRDMALRPAYGGYRTHTPGATAGGVYRGPLPAEPNAAWPALVDQAVFWRVRRLLLAPERRTSRPRPGEAPAVADRHV
jgi:site-specific DNA recombinase